VFYYTSQIKINTLVVFIITQAPQLILLRLTNHLNFFIKLFYYYATLGAFKFALGSVFFLEIN